MACMEVWGGNRAIDNGVVMPGLDAWVYSLPFAAAGQGAADAGGDIHYVTSCATGRITRLIVADVSGHGAPVARAADALRRLMRKHSNYIDQTKLVRAVNSEFGQIGGESAGNDSAGVLFATAVVATYFAPTDELAVSNAGHPRPMRFDAKRAEWMLIESAEDRGSGPTNLPLGIVEDANYPAATVRLRPDDLVLFYTDSLIEAKDAGGKLLGHEGLRRVLGEVDPSCPELFVRSVLTRIAGLTGRGDSADELQAVFNDDVTALLVRRNALKPRPSIGLATMGGVRIVREAIRSLLPGSLPAAFPQVTVRSLGGAMARWMN
jgi:serine phosphatase RsbU (regulator of sigma subunit)